MHERHSTFSPCSSTFQIRVGATAGEPSSLNIARIVVGVLTASSDEPWICSYTLARPACVLGFGSAPAAEEIAAKPSAVALTRNRFVKFVITFLDFLAQYCVPAIGSL